jgi:hypothetical protein
MSEARLFRGRVAENATREPEEPAEADPGVVKRRVPQSLFPGASLGERARRKSRKDAGNTRGASARSRSSGKQKSVGTHRARATRTVARQVGKGRASPSQTVGSADADDGSPSLERIGSEGRSGAGPKAWSLAAKRRVMPASSENGARASRQNVTGKACRSNLFGVARRRVYVAERLRVSAEAGRISDTMEGVSSRSSIFSLRGDGSSNARGRWNDSGLSVEPNLVRSRVEHGGGAGGRNRSRQAGAGR